MTLAARTALELKGMIEGGRASSREVMASALDEIERREADLGAFILLRDRAELLAEAGAVDARRAAGEAVGPLAGLPITIKDNICTDGMATTCASRMLAGFVPPYDATVVTRVRAADGIIVGKANMDEFAMGSSTEHSAVKLTRNPHDRERVPGGSSGGSAVAVAAHFSPLSLGSDTGGSIRQPASFCGVVGLKPTYGRVSRYGLVAFASSLDQIGPFSRSVADAALMLGAIAGHDWRDSTSIDAPVPDYLASLDERRAFRIGVPTEYMGEEGLDPEVRAAVERAIELIRADGHEIVPVSLPHTAYAVATYFLIACSEASSNLARYDGVKYGLRAEEGGSLGEMYARTRSAGFGAEVKRRIMLGTYALSSGYYDAYYLKAGRVRTLLIRDFAAAFGACDVIAHPVTPNAAFRIGENTSDPIAMYLQDIYTVTANLVGIPALSMPCGKTRAGLPIGIQFSARHLDETTLFQAAHRMEGLLRSA
jgi:aspartyl-tRNA(Asn)/glutamyl-tRNA(Gln) amidotransferase subunit A